MKTQNKSLKNIDFPPKNLKKIKNEQSSLIPRPTPGNKQFPGRRAGQRRRRQQSVHWLHLHQKQPSNRPNPQHQQQPIESELFEFESYYPTSTDARLRPSRNTQLRGRINALGQN